MGISKVPFTMTEAELVKFKDKFRIPDAVKLVAPLPNERAYFLRRDCDNVSDAILQIHI